ncbi:MAG TPA: glycosyltransferase [Thermoanaerobaculia bacterium]|nr:glycosyltransferase [Thermoanaerobaculia bacterium]
MSRPLRILFTNITLASRTGTEVYIKEAALGLLRRGHTPLVYSPDLGEIAEEIRAATVPVVDDLARLGAPPDVIHGHHHQQAMTAMLHFPGVSGIFATHDWTVWHDTPPLFPRIRRYLAVDWTNRDRVLFEHGIPEERVRVLLNWVDLDRFPPRGPLPERPRRALVFSNYAREDTHLPAVEEACRRAGLPLDVVGSGVGRSLAHPGEVIAEYDLVFAKAKSALEALAVGTAVVLCDYRGLGQMVTGAELDALRRLNLGLRTLRHPLVPELILREIERYDARDAAEVSRRVREEAGLEPALDRLVALYEEVIAEHQREGPADPAEESRAAAVYLRDWAGWIPHLKNVAADLDKQRQWLDHRVRELEEELRQVRRAQPAAALKEEELRTARLERDRLAETLRSVTGTITWRLREKLMRFPGLRAVYQKIRRL